MSGFTFDSNIVIDALAGFAPARDEIRRASAFGVRAWVSRMVWVEVLSKGEPDSLAHAEAFLAGFGKGRRAQSDGPGDVAARGIHDRLDFLHVHGGVG